MSSTSTPTPTPTTTSTTTACSICCEDNKPNLVSLSKCSHSSCKDCLVQWIVKVESTGQADLPGCPFCRLALTKEQTELILGRPFTPATAASNGGNNVWMEMDELTLQLLQSQTKPCPRCGAWIEKLQGGCDMMECLCGYRFCYGCGAQGARCTCTPETHSFWDNVLDRNAGRSAAQEAPLNEETGQVDFATHIQRRKRADEHEQIRKQRASRRQRHQYELRTIEFEALTYISAVWLYRASTNATTIKMLTELHQQSRIKMERASQQRLQQREVREQDPLVTTCRWLFLPPQGAFAVLEQLKRRSTYYSRTRQRAIRDSDAQFVDDLTYSARWLFVPSSLTGFKMLRNQRHAERTRQDRDRKRRMTGNYSLPNEAEQPDYMVVTGSWLYQRSTPKATMQQMERLYRHQSKAARARFNRRFPGSFGCGNLGCACWEGDFCRAQGSDQENAMAIRLLFLTTEQERLEEKQAIAKYGL